MDQPVLQGDKSVWTLWSLGTVVEDAIEGSRVIKVNPNERLPLQEGQVGTNSEQYEGTAKTTDGVAGSQSVVASDVITATWLLNGDNHLWTVPMVRKNETVKIYKYSDKQEFFWTTMMSSPEFRKTERIVYGASNLSGEGTVDIDDLYHIEFDTLTKELSIRTSLSDGEEFGYELSLNPREKKFWAKDHVGNIIELDSPTNNISLTDISGGKIETRDGHPKITGTKGILLTSPSNVIEGDTVFTDSVVVKKTFTSVGLLTMNSGMAMQPGNGGAGGEAIFDGNLRIKQTLTVDGTSTFNGYASFNAGHGPHP